MATTISINEAVSQIREDIAQIKELFTNIPPEPNNKRPPSALARF